MLRQKKILIYAIILTFTVFLSPQIALSIQNFQVQPTKVDFDGALVKEQKKDVIVINKSNKAIEVEVIIKDFSFSNTPKNRYVLYKSGSLKNSAASYLKISPFAFKIPANSRQKVLVIYKPKSTLFSEKSSVVLFAVKGKVRKDSENINITSRIGVRVFVSPSKGHQERKGKINYFSAKNSFGLDIPFVGIKKRPSFILSYKNEGNNYLVVRGDVEIFDSTGERIEIISMRSNEIMAKTSRDIEMFWDEAATGRYSAKVKVKFEKDGKSVKQISGTSDFFYIEPWIFAIGIFFTIYILLMITKFVIKKTRGRVESRE